MLALFSTSMCISQAFYFNQAKPLTQASCQISTPSYHLTQPVITPYNVPCGATVTSGTGAGIPPFSEDSET